VGLASGPASNATSHSAYTSGLSTAPIVPNIWEDPAVGVLRVTPINSAVPGCEVLALASVDTEIALLIVKKEEINASKIYSPSGNFAERAK